MSEDCDERQIFDEEIAITQQRRHKTKGTQRLLTVASIHICLFYYYTLPSTLMHYVKFIGTSLCIVI